MTLGGGELGFSGPQGCLCGPRIGPFQGQTHFTSFLSPAPLRCAPFGDALKMWGAGKTDVGNPPWAALSQGSPCSQKHRPTKLLGPAPPGNDAAGMFPGMTQHPLFAHSPPCLHPGLMGGSSSHTSQCSCQCSPVLTSMLTSLCTSRCSQVSLRLSRLLWSLGLSSEKQELLVGNLATCRVIPEPQVSVGCGKHLWASLPRSVRKVGTYHHSACQGLSERGTHCPSCLMKSMPGGQGQV